MNKVEEYLKLMKDFCESEEENEEYFNKIVTEGQDLLKAMTPDEQREALMKALSYGAELYNLDLQAEQLDSPNNN